MKYRVYNAAGIVVFKAVSYDALMRQVYRVFQLSGFIPSQCRIATPTLNVDLEPQFSAWLNSAQSPRPKRVPWNHDDFLTLDES